MKKEDFRELADFLKSLTGFPFSPQIQEWEKECRKRSLYTKVSSSAEALLNLAKKDLITVARMPDYEHVADAHNTAVRLIQEYE